MFWLFEILINRYKSYGSSLFSWRKYLLIILIYIASTHIHPPDAEITSIYLYYSVHLLKEVV